jgi:hypothetical protein
VTAALLFFDYFFAAPGLGAKCGTIASVCHLACRLASSQRGAQPQWRAFDA